MGCQGHSLESGVKLVRGQAFASWKINIPLTAYVCLLNRATTGRGFIADLINYRLILHEPNCSIMSLYVMLYFHAAQIPRLNGQKLPISNSRSTIPHHLYL